MCPVFIACIQVYTGTLIHDNDGNVHKWWIYKPILRNIIGTCTMYINISKYMYYIQYSCTCQGQRFDLWYP